MSDAGSGGRPRPQYGEYASAAEQRARIQVPQHEEQPAPPVPAPPLWGASPQAPARPAPAQAANRVITIGLLAYGAINVLMSVFSFLDLSTVIDTTYRIMGVPGSFANQASAHTWGIVAAIVLVLGYAGTVWWSVHVMRRGRLSWWIPLVGAAVTYVIVSVFVAIPMMTDPAFVTYVTGSN
ncbi:DUF6264 family protein [Microbacterium sp. KR10-403]|uniref:DUF6264 family protein n=1 Tax=Microbacterium sp. KR10-403 TaxID=3158581 RepID=UPI0032E3F920